MTTETRLVAAHETVRGHEASTNRARAARDELIRAAITGGMSAYRVAKVLGLSERAVHKIRDAR